MLPKSTLMTVIRWTLFRALFQPEFRHFRSFLSMDDLVWSIIYNLSDFEVKSVHRNTLIRVGRTKGTLCASFRTISWLILGP